MNRVAIHLPFSPPVDPPALRILFREIQRAGGRVVTMAMEVDDTEAELRELIDQLGDDFDQLFSLVGADLFEWAVSNRLVVPALSPPVEAYY